jgi:hypothetical protein
MKLSRKGWVIFLIILIVPSINIGAVTYSLGSYELSKQVFDQQEATRSVKRKEVEKFFSNQEDNIVVLAEIISLLAMQNDNLETAVIALTKPGSSQEESFVDSFMKTYNFRDVFIIKPSGDIIYSEVKEKKFESNHINGTYKGSHLARVFNRVKQDQGFVLEKFSSDESFGKKSEVLIATPIYKERELLAIIALQF